MKQSVKNPAPSDETKAKMMSQLRIPVVAAIGFVTMLLAGNMHSTTVWLSRGFFSNTAKAKDNDDRSSLQIADANIRSGAINVRQNNTKPLLILHIGPTKTGTTTIQKIASDPEFAAEFAKDNFSYLGREFGHPFNTLMGECTYRSPEEVCQNGTKFLTKALNEHYAQGRSVFISDEMFSNSFRYNSNSSKHLLNYFRDLSGSHYSDDGSGFTNENGVNGEWDVRIIVGYRRFFSRLVSVQTQNLSNDPLAKLRNGKKFVSFPNFYRKNYVTKKSFWNGLLGKLRSNFDDVRVFNMHGISSDKEKKNDGEEKENNLRKEDKKRKKKARCEHLSQCFFCSAIPEAQGSCEYLSNKDEEVVTNVGSRKEIIIMGLRVLEDLEDRGLWNHTLIDGENSRRDIEVFSKDVEKLKEDPDYPQESEFSYDCLTEQEEKELLKTSMEMEEAIFPSFYKSRDGKGKLKESFVAMVEGRKFCSVDKETIGKIVEQYSEQIQQFLRKHRW